MGCGMSKREPSDGAPNGKAPKNAEGADQTVIQSPTQNAGGGGHKTPVNEDADFKEVHKMLDTNKDGKISREEFAEKYQQLNFKSKEDAEARFDEVRQATNPDGETLDVDGLKEALEKKDGTEDGAAQE